MAKFKINFDVPNYSLEVKEERTALRAAGKSLEKEFIHRIDSASTPWGPLKKAEDKDAKEPYVRSGQVKASITTRVSKRSGQATRAVVGPFGKRNTRLAAILTHAGKQTDRQAYPVFTLTALDERKLADEYERQVQVVLSDRPQPREAQPQDHDDVEGGGE